MDPMIHTTTVVWIPGILLCVAMVMWPRIGSWIYVCAAGRSCMVWVVD